MLQDSVFRSLDLPPAERFEAWAERMGDTHAPQYLTSDHAADYHVHQRVIALGDVTVWPATFDPLAFLRTPRLVRQSDPEAYHLSLLIEGEAVADWGRHQSAYAAQEFHVNSSSLTWQVVTGAEPVTVIGVELPRTLVALPGHRADQVVGRRISAREGTGALLAQFLRQLTADTSPYRPSDAARLGTVVADLVTAVFAHALDADAQLTPESQARTLMLRVEAHIRRHLTDPGLTPSRIAEAHHISRSHLYRLFQDQGLGVASYIRDQRLERARLDLTDPALRALPIHAVAARWGFPRPAEFTRAFRTAYGHPPSEARERALHHMDATQAEAPTAGGGGTCGRSANELWTVRQRHPSHTRRIMVSAGQPNTTEEDR